METILWDTLYSLSWAGRSMDKRRIHFREGFKKKYGNFHHGVGDLWINEDYTLGKG